MIQPLLKVSKPVAPDPSRRSFGRVLIGRSNILTPRDRHRLSVQALGGAEGESRSPTRVGRSGLGTGQMRHGIDHSPLDGVVQKMLEVLVGRQQEGSGGLRTSGDPEVILFHIDGAARVTLRGEVDLHIGIDDPQ